MMCFIYIKVYMTSDGLDISKFMWQVMTYIYERLYDKGWYYQGLYISRFIWQIMAYIYIYQGLYHKWWLIYIKIYMTSDALYISRFIWQVMAYIYQDLYDR